MLRVSARQLVFALALLAGSLSPSPILASGPNGSPVLDDFNAYVDGDLAPQSSNWSDGWDVCCPQSIGEVVNATTDGRVRPKNLGRSAALGWLGFGATLDHEIFIQIVKTSEMSVGSGLEDKQRESEIQMRTQEMPGGSQTDYYSCVFQERGELLGNDSVWIYWNESQAQSPHLEEIVLPVDFDDGDWWGCRLADQSITAFVSLQNHPTQPNEWIAVTTYTFQAGLDGLSQQITTPGYPLIRLTDTDIAGDNFGGQQLGDPCADTEVGNVVFQRMESTTISWDDAGFGVSYDVVVGSLTELRKDARADAAQCGQNDLQNPRYDDDTPDPQAGEGHYYLIRPQSACGAGTYGFASSGEERLPISDCL